MHIIPVIDLLNGVVVHAKQGQRANYQPIQSALTTSTHPLDIVKAFKAIYAFDTLYIADLNAIQRIKDYPNNAEQIHALLSAFPELTIWLDAGFTQLADFSRWQAYKVRPVLGSESFRALDDYLTLSSQLKVPPILSLDFMPQGYQGPQALLSQSEHWPDQVIVMSLNHVGANKGLDMATLLATQQVATHHQLYAAGGVRNLEDLTLLQQHQMHGALVASALHAQKISAADLLQITQ